MPISERDIEAPACNALASAYCRYLDTIARVCDAGPADSPCEVSFNSKGQATAFIKDFESPYRGTAGMWSFRLSTFWDMRNEDKVPSLEEEKMDFVAAEVGRNIDENYTHYEKVYENFHQHPEVARSELQTSKALTAELKRIGFDVTENFAGFGVVAVMKNGEGPTALVRAEMDALPVKEETGLPYQSLNPGVMHACGHDVHMAVMLGTAEALVELKDMWHGTLVFVGQPAEETGEGAKAMIDAGLFKRFPRPDYALSVHVSASKPAGAISYKKGWALANIDYVDVVFTGPGGHGATPEGIANPIELASQFVLGLKTFVAGVNKEDTAVVSVCSFQGGTEHNVIPKEIHLQMTSRSFKPEVRKTLKEGIVKLAGDVAHEAGSPTPSVEYREGVPSLYNDPKIVERVVPVFTDVVGKEGVIESKQSMYGDDFSFYGYETGIPVFQFGLGAQPKDVDSKNWPRAHSPKFAPEFKEVYRIGVKAMTLAIVELQN